MGIIQGGYMEHIKLFFKGIVVGIGGIAPGLSGSVLMVILGLYTKVINAIASLFKNFKKNMTLLIPIGIGMVLGVVLFSRFIDFTLDKFEIQTRLMFLGLIIGTIPLFFREVQKKKDIKIFHYILMIIALAIGLYLFTFNNKLFASIKEMNFIYAFILGFIGISATVIPGIDGAATLSALGLYEQWLKLTSLTDINLAIYIPAALGMITSAFLLSKFISVMIKHHYTATFSILFGFFLSVTPTVLKQSSGSFISLGNNTATYVGIALFVVGLIASYGFGKFKREDE